MNWLEHLLTADSFPIDRTALVGWALYTVCFAITLPLGSLAIARRRSRLVFLIRAVEAAIGLIALATVLAVDPQWAPAAPFCLSGGGLISWGLLWYWVQRDERSAQWATGRVDPAAPNRSKGQTAPAGGSGSGLA